MSSCGLPVARVIPVQLHSTTTTSTTGVNYTATDRFCSKCLIYLCKFDMHAEFAEFSIRLVASLKVLHLYHHVSELIKLPIYDFARPPRPYTRLQSSLIDMQPLEFTIMIKPFSTGKGLSLLESAIDHSVFLSRGFIDPIQDFNQVLLHVLIPLIHGLPI